MKCISKEGSWKQNPIKSYQSNNFFKKYYKISQHVVQVKRSIHLDKTTCDSNAAYRYLQTQSGDAPHQNTPSGHLQRLCSSGMMQNGSKGYEYSPSESRKTLNSIKDHVGRLKYSARVHLLWPRKKDAGKTRDFSAHKMEAFG